jgi:hypothetical protein
LIGKPAGVAIPLTLVGFARANARGQYAVSASPASIMTTNGQHGYVNLQVVAVSGGEAAEVNYSVAPTGAAWTVEGGTASAPAASFNFATRVATTTPTAATAGTSTAVESRIPFTPAAPSAALERLRQDTAFASADTPMSPDAHATPNIVVCTITPESIYYNKPEHFMTTETVGGNIRKLSSRERTARARIRLA